ncbi:hypothetical protein TFLX_04369 [Thermoflexales bacterium]|nr:hypothetical protein TFLX_04369 [Thermoflexales bacterium]
METSSIQKLNPRLQSVFGILTPSDDAEIRKILSDIDVMLLEFAHFFGSNHAGGGGTGLDLVWIPSGQIKISSFVGAGLDGDHIVDFTVSLQPTWFYGDFPTEQGWEIIAEINADCQHKVYCGNMHCVYELPSVTCTHPVDAAIALRNMTADLIQLGKNKPIEYWLQLAGDSHS